jgi:hypothetical protein
VSRGYEYMYDPSYSPEAKDWRSKARETGEICGGCGQAFGKADPRYRVNVYGEYVSMCGGCAPEWLTSGRGKPVRILPAVDVHAWECAGCGSEVIFGMTDWQYRKRVYCSDRCRKEAARKRHKPAEPHNITCEVCGTEFTARRSDARTCSPACRQRAYRKRAGE